MGNKEICQDLKRRIEIRKKEELLDILWKEKSHKIKLRLLSLNLIANCNMDVKNIFCSRYSC